MFSNDCQYVTYEGIDEITKIASDNILADSYFGKLKREVIICSVFLFSDTWNQCNIKFNDSTAK